MIILSPSILGADFTKLGEQVAEVDKAGAQYIHLDVMDGAFVPSISFGMPVIKSLRPVTDRVFDVHMMVEEPGRYVEDIKKAGADLICVHQEACLHLDRTIAQIREAGLQTGVALNPATPVETLDVILPEVDMVLLMTVNPGFGGQKFIPYTVEKIKKLRAMCSERGLSTRIEVDGGITPDDVSYVNAHGTSTHRNDLNETLACKKIFGDRAKQVPISSNKSMTGHLLGAAGGMEAVASVLTIETGIIPPTINYEDPDTEDEMDLDYVPNVARKADVDVVLSNNFGFGGHNACVAFRKYKD